MAVVWRVVCVKRREKEKARIDQSEKAAVTCANLPIDVPPASSTSSCGGGVGEGGVRYCFDLNDEHEM